MFYFVIKQYIYRRTLEFEYAVEGKNIYKFHYCHNKLLIHSIPNKFTNIYLHCEKENYCDYSQIPTTLQTFKKYAYKFWDDDFSTLFVEISHYETLPLKKWLWKFLSVNDFNSIDLVILKNYYQYQNYQDLEFIMDKFNFKNFASTNDDACKFSIIKFLYMKKLRNEDEIIDIIKFNYNDFVNEQHYEIVDFISELNQVSRAMMTFIKGYTTNAEVVAYALQKTNFIFVNELVKQVIKHKYNFSLKQICQITGPLKVKGLTKFDIYCCNENSMIELEKYCDIDLNDFFDSRRILEHGAKIHRYFYKKTSHQHQWKSIIANKQFSGFIESYRHDIIHH